MSEYNQLVDEKISALKDARIFFLADPFSNDSRLNFDGQLTDEYFFDHFFSLSKDAEKTLANIKQAAEEEHQILFIAGYKGCGKTTFINYLCRDKDKKIVNYERSPSAADPIKSHLVNAVYDVIREDKDRGSKILKSMIEVFFNVNSKKIIDRKLDSRHTIIEFLECCEQLLNLAAYSPKIRANAALLMGRVCLSC
jgi:chromosomal replication initiation ATPase DnaA